MYPTVVILLLLFQPTQPCIDRMKTAGLMEPKPFVRISTPGGNMATPEESKCYDIYVGRVFMDPIQFVKSQAAPEAGKDGKKKKKSMTSVPLRDTDPEFKKEPDRPSAPAK